MEIDLAQPASRSIAPSNVFRSDVCIIGAGIAGLTLAHKLVQLGLEVVLLDAGGRTSDPRSTAGEILQTGDLHAGAVEERVRAFGGTSLLWGGQLLPLPEGAAWPVRAEELNPYSAEAERLIAVDDLPYDADGFFAHLSRPAPAGFTGLPQLETTVSKFAPFSHRNLAHTLGSSLRRHAKAHMLLHAPAIELVLSPSHNSIGAVLVGKPGGQMQRIEATHFVLAAGTIENARLLLASRSVAADGIGNHNDQVGRNFHDHLTVTAATIHAPARKLMLAALRPWMYRGTLHSLKLNASPELRARLNLTPVMAHLTIAEPESSGIGALRTLLRARQEGRLLQGLRKAGPQLPRALGELVRLTWSARMKRRRYVSAHAGVHLRLNAAQHTPSASRITLSAELDALGRPKAVLDWRVHDDELATLRGFAAHLRAILQPTHSKGIQWNSSLLDPTPSAPISGLDDARHAMGGCCMGTDPGSSVVTPELRVHGLRNLYIASVATFPDGSPQLPTLPLMALTLRLADHLHRQN